MRKVDILLMYLVILFFSSCKIKSENKMESIELSTGETVMCKSLDKNEYDRLMENAMPFLNVYKDKLGIDVNEIKGSKDVIVRDGNYMTLYFNREGLDKVLMNSSPSFEALLNKNPYGIDFPHKSKALCDELTMFFSLKNYPIDTNLLMAIDEKMDLLTDPISFKRKYFIHLISIIGEAVINKYNGTWVMQLGSDSVTWNPFISIRHKEVQFFTYLYEDIFISDNSGQILIETFDTVDAIIKQNPQ